MSDTKKLFVPTRYSAKVLPRTGQRVRFAISQKHAAADWKGVILKGTLCDVVDLLHVADEGVHPVLVVDAYIREDETVRAVRVEVLPEAVESVKGKPFVVGVDDRRRDTSATSASGKRDEADELADLIRDRLGKGGKVDPAEVERIVAEYVDENVNPSIDAVRSTASDMAERVGEVEDRTTAVESAVTGVESKLVDVLDALASATPSAKRRARAVLTGAPSGNVIADRLAQFYTPGVDRGVNVLLCSPPSLGKSFAVRKFAEDYDLFLEHGCSADMDEIATVLGSPIPDGEGGFAVTDGVFTEAVRAAASGKTVLLLLDEALRLSERVQEWLLTVLTGVKRPDGTRFYRLRTRKLDSASGALETITCEATHLHIVAATNLGMLSPVEAFWSRWHKVRLSFDSATVTGVADAVLASYGIADREKLAKGWAEVVVGSRKMAAEGKLRFPADIRTLENAARLCDDGDPRTVARLAVAGLADQCAHWSADLGESDPDSVAAADALGAILLASL